MVQIQPRKLVRFQCGTRLKSASEQARNAALTSAPLVSPLKGDLFLFRDKSDLSLKVGKYFFSKSAKARKAGKIGRNLVIHREFKLKVHSSGFQLPTATYGMNGSRLCYIALAWVR